MSLPPRKPRSAPTLRTERLVLRGWRPGDLEAYAALNADTRVMQHFPAPWTRAQSIESMRQIAAHFDRHGFGVWTLELIDEGQFAGIAGLKVPTFEAPFMPCVEILWRVPAALWGRGIATEAARAALDFGFTEVGLTEIVAYTTPANAASLRVMEKLGMRRDPTRDFEHPSLPAGHRLRPHLFYALASPPP